MQTPKAFVCPRCIILCFHDYAAQPPMNATTLSPLESLLYLIVCDAVLFPYQRWHHVKLTSTSPFPHGKLKTLISRKHHKTSHQKKEKNTKICGLFLYYYLLRHKASTHKVSPITTADEETQTYNLKMNFHVVECLRQEI